MCHNTERSREAHLLFIIVASWAHVVQQTVANINGEPVFVCAKESAD